MTGSFSLSLKRGTIWGVTTLLATFFVANWQSYPIISAYASLLLWVAPFYLLLSLILAGWKREVGYALAIVFLLALSVSLGVLSAYLTILLGGNLSKIWPIFSFITIPLFASFKITSSQRSLKFNPVEILALAFLILLASFLRFKNLSHAELQGDEARAFSLAYRLQISSESGNGLSVLVNHKKGPHEVLLPALQAAYLPLQDYQHLPEWSGRVPSAVLGVITVLLLFFVARVLLPNCAILFGLLAGIIAACDGFLIGLTRIAQYQGGVNTATLAALLALLLPNLPRALLISAIFFTFGLYAHYDTLLFAPLLLAVALYRKFSWRDFLLPTILSLIVLSIFYLPFLYSDSISNTTGYLSDRIRFHKLPFNNLVDFFLLWSFYNSAYFTTLISLFVFVAASWYLYRSASPPRISKLSLLPVPLLVALLIYAHFNRDPKLLNWIMAILLLVIGVWIFCSWVRRDKENNNLVIPLTLLGILPALLLFGFFFFRPNTHYYVILPIIALAVSYIALKSFWLRGILFLSVALNFYYVFSAFTRLEPEYRYLFPRTQLSLYPYLSGRYLPKGAYFGFPHRSGWSALHRAYLDGKMRCKSDRCSYDSKEEELITEWYLRGLTRGGEEPDYLFIPRFAHDRVPFKEHLINSYHFWGRVYVGAAPKMDVYSKHKIDTPVRLQN
jgi:hypothetical protein